MRAYFPGLVILFLLTASCGSGSAGESTIMEQPTQAGEMASEAPKYTPGAKMDPVCEMEWDNEWTEMTVYKNDTVRFCSEGCKKAFEAHPDKYVAAAK